MWGFGFHDDFGPRYRTFKEISDAALRRLEEAKDKLKEFIIQADFSYEVFINSSFFANF